MKKVIFVLSWCLLTFVAYAANPSVINAASCGTLADRTEPFILVLNSGEKLVESITQCAEASKITAASISGLGQVQNPTLAYFDSKAKQYRLTTLPGVFEMASLNGNIAIDHDKRVTHAHVVLGDLKYRAQAGHLQEAIVGATAEITIVPMSGPAQRQMNDVVGLKLLVP